MQILSFVLARFSEPSSYAGLGALLGLVGLHFSNSELGQLAQLLAAGCGLAALVLRERGVIPAILLALLVAGGLAACTPLIAAGAATGAAGTVAATVVGDVNTAIQTACTDYAEGRAAANAVLGTGLVPADIAGKVTTIEEYGDAACANPPSGDAVSTAIWLGELVGQIAALTSTAAPATSATPPAGSTTAPASSSASPAT